MLSVLSFPKGFSFLAACLVVRLLAPSVAFASGCTDWVSKAVSIQGHADLQRANQTNWMRTNIKETFCIGDTIRVGANSRILIIYRDNSQAIFDENTVFSFLESDEDGTFWLRLRRGIGYFISRLQRKLKIKTPFMNAGVSGTEFQIQVKEKEAIVTVFEGRVLVENKDGTLPVDSGESAVTRRGEAPIIQTLVRPRAAVSWTLYYPPVLQFQTRDFEGRSPSSWESKVARSIEAYRKEQRDEAFNEISDVQGTMTDPRFFTYRASLKLSVGRISEAESDIKQALSLQPRDGDALALKSIIATVQNKKEAALTLAKQAVDAAPKAAGPRLAFSYALQADFRLSEARKEIEAAVVFAPSNGLLWSRLAELRLMFRELDKALEAAQKAIAINSDNAHTQTILGYAHLTRIDLKAAKQAFEKAIAIDESLPLPRLGLGLTQIRDGKVQAGREQIEIAVMLDPGNALVRAYMGKAYFEEKRDNLAADQYQMARALDPKDPTPDFYSAILNQSRNRPHEALEDIERSLVLNENRVVYRSRLLLDEDLAARSDSLARTYHDLGFQQLALVEGWQSVALDPSNASAHRFLADSYAVLPRSEISRVSEVLIAQLLQPINSRPVKPRLGESAPSIIAGTGSVDPSFNEFSQLFNRERFRFLSSGVWGENGLIGDEVIISGLEGPYAYSFGQLHHASDGFRANNDIKLDAHNAFLQARVNSKANLQLEYRFEKSEAGDRTLRFDPTLFSDTLREEIESKTYRFGFHYALTPHSDFLVSYSRQDRDSNFIDSTLIEFPPFFNRLQFDIDTRGNAGEMQYLHRSEQVNLIIGAGLFREEQDNFITTSLTPPGPGPLPPVVSTLATDTDSRYGNVYLYSFIRAPFQTTLILGGSQDRYRGSPRDSSRFNPKIGLIWKTSEKTTLRLAAFRVMRRTFISNQTIEPTQIAGFQQFFDESDATESDHYGIALDHRFSLKLFGGFTASKRERDIPIAQQGPADPAQVEAKEKLLRLYLYWAFLSGFSANAEYEFEEFERIGVNVLEVDFFAKTVKTHRIPLGLRFFHPRGFFAKLEITHIRQKGEFLDGFPGALISGKDDFWLTDLAIAYRLPKRFGIFRIEARNLFDKNFRYHETDILNPAIQPNRVIFTRFTFSF